MAVQGQAADVEVIRELLSPWNVSFTSLDEAEVVIAYKEKPLEPKKTIVIPSDSADFMKWVKDVKSRVVRKLGEPVFVAASSQTVLTIKPKMLYCYDGAVKPAPKDTPTAAELNEDLIFLTLDVVKEYDRILDETLNAKPSTLYRLLTGLPVPYTLAPKRLKDFFMRKRGGEESLTFCDKLPLDALRFILSSAIEKLSEKKIERKTWNGKRYACLVTHDVDTLKGLQRAKHLKKLEEKYDVPSAWYIPSKHYKLNLETIRELANYGEVGAHGTRHDGKLDQLPKQKLVERLREAKETLEKIINRSIEGFRAPLLQHNVEIIRTLEETGYTYDTSIPTWEPKHPCTMKPHGIATAYPLTINGLIEIPVTLPQDHQFLYVLGLAPKEVVEKWLDATSIIKSLGGLCTFLIHPDYELANASMDVYEELVNTIVSDTEAFITVPSEIARSQSANPY
jgi:peptidoglycan/xylan/chitin deacetylase (PgdA/CDA1 family)